MTALIEMCECGEHRKQWEPAEDRLLPCDECQRKLRPHPACLRCRTGRATRRRGRMCMTCDAAIARDMREAVDPLVSKIDQLRQGRDLVQIITPVGEPVFGTPIILGNENGAGSAALPAASSSFADQLIRDVQATGELLDRYAELAGMSEAASRKNRMEWLGVPVMVDQAITPSVSAIVTAEYRGEWRQVEPPPLVPSRLSESTAAIDASVRIVPVLDDRRRPMRMYEPDRNRRIAELVVRLMRDGLTGCAPASRFEEFGAVVDLLRDELVDEFFLAADRGEFVQLTNGAITSGNDLGGMRASFDRMPADRAYGASVNLGLTRGWRAIEFPPPAIYSFACAETELLRLLRSPPRFPKSRTERERRRVPRGRDCGPFVNPPYSRSRWDRYEEDFTRELGPSNQINARCYVEPLRREDFERALAEMGALPEINDEDLRVQTARAVAQLARVREVWGLMLNFARCIAEVVSDPLVQRGMLLE